MTKSDFLTRMQRLGEEQFNLNEQDELGRTLAWYAAYYNMPDALRELINHDADIDMVDLKGDALLDAILKPIEVIVSQPDQDGYSEVVSNPGVPSKNSMTPDIVKCTFLLMAHGQYHYLLEQFIQKISVMLDQGFDLRSLLAWYWQVDVIGNNFAKEIESGAENKEDDQALKKIVNLLRGFNQQLYAPKVLLNFIGVDPNHRSTQQQAFCKRFMQVFKLLPMASYHKKIAAIMLKISVPPVDLYSKPMDLLSVLVGYLRHGLLSDFQQKMLKMLTQHVYYGEGVYLFNVYFLCEWMLLHSSPQTVEAFQVFVAVLNLNFQGSFLNHFRLITGYPLCDKPMSVLDVSNLDNYIIQRAMSGFVYVRLMQSIGLRKASMQSRLVAMNGSDLWANRQSNACMQEAFDKRLGLTLYKPVACSFSCRLT